MKIIIAPAKKMNVDTDSLAWQDQPVLLHKTRQLMRRLQEMEPSELKKIWKCNDSIAELNIQRLKDMDLDRNLTPAILAYEGIAFQYMAPGVFTQSEFDYVQRHLRILSGFYGILKPFDGVTPYRLEMQAKLSVDGMKDLYAFWGSDIADNLLEETQCVVNLASKEYSLCVSRHLQESVRMITCVFGEEKDGAVVEKGTLCKMARGEMVRFMAERSIENPEEIKAFDRLNYRYAPERSDADTFVFLLHKHK